MTLTFDFDWLDAPGVEDTVLSATWAEFGIRIDGDSWLTASIDQSAKSVRRRIVLPLFPLAAWFVENWWFLQVENCPVGSFSSGRQLSRSAAYADWTRRHNLLAAQEGFLLPDLTIYTLGDQIAVQAAPDRSSDRPDANLSFIAEKWVTLDAMPLFESIGGFVQRVLDRLEQQGLAENPEVQSLMQNWVAIGGSDFPSAQQCQWSALMGVDPYDPDELTEAVLDVLDTRVEPLPKDLRDEFLSAIKPTQLTGDLDWLEQLREEFASVACVADATGSQADVPSPHASATLFAADYGYALARWAREHTFQLDHTSPISSFEDLFLKSFANGDLIRETERSPDKRLEGYVAANGVPHMAVGAGIRTYQKRFRVGRSLFHWLRHKPNETICEQLVTAAYTWEQQASRAFSAELLMPHRALQEQIGDQPASGDQIDELAETFGVGPMTVRHQIENHGIGPLPD